MCQVTPSTGNVDDTTTRTNKKDDSIEFIDNNKLSGVHGAEENLRRGIFHGSMALGLLILSFSLLMPHLQSRRDALECDSLCYGSLTSGRSLLQLVGSAAVGRLSDRGRMSCLYLGTVASLIGLIITAVTFSIQGMWLAMIPGALLQQNFSVLKALFADYHEALHLARTNSTLKSDAASLDDASARAGSVGKLGMTVGLAFMVGPLLGATVVKTFEQATILAILAVVVSAIFVSFLPTLPAKPTSCSISSNKKSAPNKGWWTFLDVKAARSPPAIFLIIVRVFMALAFHIFNTIWTVSLKTRFDFGPSDHGKFFSFIGLAYALSQGFVAKKLISYMEGSETTTTTSSSSSGNKNIGRVRVVQLCCLALGFGRYFAFRTTSLVAVYFIFGVIITALGVVNTILTADTSNVAPASEIGGLYGFMEAVQSLAGMIGPMLGGSLAYLHPIHAPLGMVVSLYFIIFVMVTFGYESYVLTPTTRSENKTQQERS
jgi:MFS family permease